MNKIVNGTQTIVNRKVTALLNLILIIFTLLTISCGDIYQPKPKGYFRIDFPKKSYIKFDNNYPYTFEYPAYSKVVADTEKEAEPYWINVIFPKYRGTLHVSYKNIVSSSMFQVSGSKNKHSQNSLNEYIEDSRMFAMKHMTKANGIDERVINNRNDKVYGLIYNISGSGTASTYQFYLTDSTSHFLRGALYFYFKPNNDSIAPVIDFIKQDIDHMIKTFRWKK